MGELNLVNRDPNNLNAHVKCAFEDVLGETDGVHAIDCVWSNTYKCFECWKSLLYKIVTLLCGICIGSYWGCVFSCIACEHVWCITPFMKVVEMKCSIFRNLCHLCVGCLLGPCCETCAIFFSKIKIQKG